MFWRVVNIVYGHVISGLYKLFKYDVIFMYFHA